MSDLKKNSLFSEIPEKESSSENSKLFKEINDFFQVFYDFKIKQFFLSVYIKESKNFKKLGSEKDLFKKYYNFIIEEIIDGV